jgi:hypothetical protein
MNEIVPRGLAPELPSRKISFNNITQSLLWAPGCPRSLTVLTSLLVPLQGHKQQINPIHVSLLLLKTPTNYTKATKNSFPHEGKNIKDGSE